MFILDKDNGPLQPLISKNCMDQPSQKSNCSKKSLLTGIQEWTLMTKAGAKDKVIDRSDKLEDLRTCSKTDR